MKSLYGDMRSCVHNDTRLPGSINGKKLMRPWKTEYCGSVDYYNSNHSSFPHWLIRQKIGKNVFSKKWNSNSQNISDIHNNKYASNTTFSCTNTNKGSSALSHASRFLRRMLATLTAKPHTLLSFGRSCEREEMNKKEFTNGCALLVRLKVAPRLHYNIISDPEGLMHNIPI